MNDFGLLSSGIGLQDLMYQHSGDLGVLSHITDRMSITSAACISVHIIVVEREPRFSEAARCSNHNMSLIGFSHVLDEVLKDRTCITDE